MSSTLKPKWVAYDVDEITKKELNHMYGFTEKPEKIYRDHIDNYGDRRDKWRAL